MRMAEEYGRPLPFSATVDERVLMMMMMYCYFRANVRCTVAQYNLCTILLTYFNVLHIIMIKPKGTSTP